VTHESDTGNNQIPEFLLGLGRAYTSANLLDAAEEVLAKIPRHHSLYKEAVLILLAIHNQRRNAQEIIRLSEELLNGGSDPLWPSRYMGIAYYWEGQTDAAKGWLWRSLAYLPDNFEVQRRLERVRPKIHPPRIKSLIRPSPRVGMTPHTVLDCIAPLLWEGRSVTCCFEDGFLFCDPTSSSASNIRRAFLDLAEHLYAEFGIYTGFLRYLPLEKARKCQPTRKVFFSKQPTLFDDLAWIEQLVWKEFEDHDIGRGLPRRSEEREGSVLGYPPCCVRWTMHTRGSGESIEETALTALIREECVSSFLGWDKIQPPEFAYFAFEFYPCGPRCAAAEQVGKDILARYVMADTTLAEFYRHHVLPLNKARMWSCRSAYQDFIALFNAHTYGASQTAWQKMCAAFKRLRGGQ